MTITTLSTPVSTTPISISVAVVSTSAVVAAGLTAMLDDAPDPASPLQVVDLGSLPTGAGAVAPDVVLYDAHALADGDGADLHRLLTTTTSTVLAVHHELRPALAAEALMRGAHGTVDLATDRAGLHAAVTDAARAGRPEGEATTAVPLRLGADAGLTPREVDVLTMITQGYSNQEIAERSYLSINSVKTYIRSAYRRIGVTSRSQAVVWCVRHGFPSAPAAA